MSKHETFTARRHFCLKWRAAVPKSVLVVEDEEIIREMTIVFLEEAGLTVRGCESADEAARLLETIHEDVGLLFTDVRMPGRMDGLALARRTMERWPHVRVIVTSGMLNHPDNQIPDGAEFLPKPWMPLEMLTKVMHAATTPAYA
jgi:two-component system, response regulator PdtaR